MYIISAFVLIIILVAYLLVYSQPINQEGFYGEDGGYGPQYCGDCNRRGEKGMNACLSCNNCGWCVDPNGYGSCVLGDYTGPYFADCAQYYYNGGMAVANGPPVAPYGPAVMPWYQKFIPWYGGFGDGNINPQSSYMGNNFYNVNSPLKNTRRWAPTGDIRLWNN